MRNDESAQRKHEWEELYRAAPESARAEVLVQTDAYDRIGPIILPLKTRRSGIVNFTLYYFGFYQSGESYYLLTVAEQLAFMNPLVRVSSNCNWAFDLDSVRCECDWELQEAKARIAEEPSKDGLIVFALDQHGKSIPGGARGHAFLYALGQAQNQDLVHDAYVKNGFAVDYRAYDDVCAILRTVGVATMRLLTNNPDRVRFFQSQGFTCERESIEKPYDFYDSEELGVKKDRLRHDLELPGFHPSHVEYYGLDPSSTFPHLVSRDRED